MPSTGYAHRQFRRLRGARRRADKGRQRTGPGARGPYDTGPDGQPDGVIRQGDDPFHDLRLSLRLPAGQDARRFRLRHR